MPREMTGTSTPTRPEDLVRDDVWLAPPWRVILHNDDVTTMEFVVWLLESLFRKSAPEAYRLMMEVHTRGLGVAAVCAQERAELYVEQVHSLAAAGVPPDGHDRAGVSARH
jgi:ATP-dependent Clp protease adaptor protein ClpS